LSLDGLPIEMQGKVHTLVGSLVTSLQNAQEEVDKQKGVLEEAEKIIRMLGKHLKQEAERNVARPIMPRH